MIRDELVDQRVRDVVVSRVPAVPDLVRSHGRWFAMNRSYRANKILKRLVGERVDAFESQVLEDWMHTVDDGDELVDHYAMAIANAEQARDAVDENYGRSDPLTQVTAEAADGLEGAMDAHLDVLVAEICATVALREGSWVEHTDGDDAEEAVHEAREWLQENEDAAKRAGVWEEVCA